MSRLGHAAASGSGANPKGSHYIANLGATLVRGAWGDANPGATPSGSALSWSELVRKWGKHTGGNTEVVNSLRTIALYDLAASSRVPPANAASQIGAADVASSELSSGSAQAGGRNAPPNGSALVPQLPQAPEPTSTDGDGADGASAEAWAHGSHWGRSPLQPEHADELRKASANLQSMVAGLKLSTAEVTSASLAVAYSLYALTDYDKALTAYSSFDWASDPTVGVVNGDAAVVERVRARATQGMCFELCSRPDASLALQCYLEAVKLMDKFAVSPMPTPAYLLPANAPRPSLPSADSQRELMRYMSTSLTRATAIVAHTADSHLTLRILRTYHTLAASWSPSFRPRQRQRMLNVYLAALFESFPSAGATVPEPLLLSGGVANRTGRATWRAEVVEAFRYGQRMLGDTTRFPKAGKLNVPVVQFADQVSMFPDHTPSLTRDAITILWWSTNLTFQSQLILRRLTCLLATTNDTLEARRVFELYVDTVLKARLTENPDSTLALQRQKSIDDSELTDNPNDEQLVDANGHGEKDPVVRYGEMDGDTDFVSTLLVGTRLLLTDLKDAKEAWRYATLAGDIGKSGQLSRKVMALVEENKGVVRQVMSTTEADRVHRPKYQAQAINHLRRATQLDPHSSRAFYHLAYAEASARSIQPALQAVRESLELDSHSVRSWHLLALLLTASGDWEAALKACEAGVSLWETDDEALESEEGDLPTVSVNGNSGTHQPQPTLSPDGHLLPPTPAKATPQSRFRRLESVIQLRMTLNVITEKLQGPDIALEQQQDLFSFFSQRTEKGEKAERRKSGTISTRALSTSGTSRSPAPTAPTDVYVQPPSPTIPETGTLSPPRISTQPSTPGDSAVPSDAEEPRRLAHKRSLLPKHLHVPSVAHTHSRTVSAPSNTPALRGPADFIQKSRAASTTSTMGGAASIAPTAVHSHYHGGRPSAPPPPPLKVVVRRSPAEERILSNLWLMSAASFRRTGKLEQSLVAIEEAETRDPENPAVWVQLGLWHRAMQASTSSESNSNPDPSGEAQAAFTKSLLLRPDYPPGAVSVARLHVTTGQVDLAHSLLSQLVQDRGWDVPEAWFALATVCERQDRHARARECLLYALQLERTRTCRALPDALPRWSD